MFRSSENEDARRRIDREWEMETEMVTEMEISTEIGNVGRSDRKEDFTILYIERH